MDQKQAAFEAMTEWLSDEHELGRAPAKMEHAGEFDLHGMHYYLFRYKKSIIGKWLLGVCGGYEGDDLQHCGHVFSEMEPYSPLTAQEDAIAMVEKIRAYWMQRAQEEMERRGIDLNEEEAEEETDDQTGPFVGFVLLNSAEFDKQAFKAALYEDWNISFPDDAEEDSDTVVFDVDDQMVAVSLMPAPVPDGEAEKNAANNYRWPQAVEVTKTHVAHLMVAVLGRGASPIEAGKLMVKVCSSCLKAENAIGLYASGTVFQPEFYQKAAAMMNEGELPVFNWIYFGLYRTEKGLSGYTYGMTCFGKDEIEILDSKATPNDLHHFLFSIANYVLEEDVTLNDGETIGFSAEQKLAITRSKGVAVEGDSLKIAY